MNEVVASPVTRFARAVASAIDAAVSCRKEVKDMKTDFTISLVSDEAWILYEDGYIEFGRFDKAEWQAERLSHYLDWETEYYPQSALEIASVLARVIENLPPLRA
jgi:hypothetical protein